MKRSFKLIKTRKKDFECSYIFECSNKTAEDVINDYYGLSPTTKYIYLTAESENKYRANCWYSVHFIDAEGNKHFRFDWGSWGCSLGLSSFDIRLKEFMKEFLKKHDWICGNGRYQ